jgi:hypothetical protein
MKKYLVLYNSPVSAREQMAKASPEQAKAGMQAWMNWAEKNKQSIVELGAPLEAAAGITNVGVSKNKSTVSGFSILKADSLDSISSMLRDHPIS